LIKSKKGFENLNDVKYFQWKKSLTGIMGKKEQVRWNKSTPNKVFTVEERTLVSVLLKLSIIQI
jgi:hypothetical protein